MEHIVYGQYRQSLAALGITRQSALSIAKAAQDRTVSPRSRSYHRRADTPTKLILTMFTSTSPNQRQKTALRKLAETANIPYMLGTERSDNLPPLDSAHQLVLFPQQWTDVEYPPKSQTRITIEEDPERQRHLFEALATYIKNMTNKYWVPSVY